MTQVGLAKAQHFIQGRLRVDGAFHRQGGALLQTSVHGILGQLGQGQALGTSGHTDERERAKDDLTGRSGDRRLARLTTETDAATLSWLLILLHCTCKYVFLNLLCLVINSNH